MADNRYRKDLFEELKSFLNEIPSVTVDSGDIEADGNWRIWLTIDIDHELAWNVVQELGHVLNFLDMRERLPTVFKPMSPAPYMNGGPKEYLAWVIETLQPVEPRPLKELLAGRLPRPLNDVEQWPMDE